MQLSDFENSIKIKRNELLEIERLDNSCKDIVYVTGSLVEGFGNSASDVDIFVLGDSNKTNGGHNLVVKKNYFIRIHYYKGRKIDFEYWSFKKVLQLINIVNRMKIGYEFLGERIDQNDKLFINRLKEGIPLLNETKFEELKQKIDFIKFQNFLIQEAIHLADGAMEDLTGMVNDGHLETGIFRSQQLIDIACDALTYYLGEGNSLPKWRFLKLQRQLDLNRNQQDIFYMLNRYLELRTKPIYILNKPLLEESIIENIKFSESTINFIQRNLNT